MLAASGLGKKFDGRWVFRGLDLRLETGQALVVEGRNGSGKSTLLKILAGLVAPTEGSAETSGGTARIGYFALDGRLYPTLTVREHFDWAAQLRGVEPRTEEWLGRIGLEAAADQWAGTLSTGMRSRVKLALAAQGEPEILLLDEPGAGLDEAGRSLVAELCREQRSRGVAVIATNDVAERSLGTHGLALGEA